MKIVSEFEDPVMKWDLYWSMVDSGEMSQASMEMVNNDLTAAAITALEKNDWKIWEDMSDKYAHLGASDTEPRSQFRQLWDTYRGR